MKTISVPIENPVDISNDLLLDGIIDLKLSGITITVLSKTILLQFQIPYVTGLLGVQKNFIICKVTN